MPLDPTLLPLTPQNWALPEKYSKPALDENLLGGDRFGRNILSRLLHGTRVSLVVGIVAPVFGTTIGAVLGLAGGYWGGKTDAISQRIVDILMSFPLIILALALLAALDRSMTTLIIAIAVPMIPVGARIVRANALVIKESQYIEAARAIGASDLRIITRHIIPGCVAPYLVILTGLIGVAIITEGALGFLGLSVPPPTPTWERCCLRQWAELSRAPHVAIAPGVAITLAVFSFNVLGDALRDVLDPRLRGRV